MAIPPAVECYVDRRSAAGGDGSTPALTGPHRAYGSLTEWEVTEQCDNADGIHRMHWAGPIADTAALTIADWVTYVDKYIDWLVDEDKRDQGKWSTNHPRLEVNANHALTVEEAFVRITGGQLRAYNPPGDYQANTILLTYAGVADFRFEKCVIRGTGQSAKIGCHGIRIGHNAQIVRASNCLFYSLNDTGSSGINISNADSVYLNNNTFCGWQNGVKIGADIATEVVLYGNLFYGQDAKAIDDGSGGKLSGDYNATNLGVLATGGGNDRTNQTFTFVDAAATPPNYALHPTDEGAQTYGTNLSGGDPSVTDDIVRYGRDVVAPDIGAFECPVVGRLNRSIKDNTAPLDRTRYRNFGGED